MKYVATETHSSTDEPEKQREQGLSRKTTCGRIPFTQNSIRSETVVTGKQLRGGKGLGLGGETAAKGQEGTLGVMRRFGTLTVVVVTWLCPVCEAPSRCQLKIGKCYCHPLPSSWGFPGGSDGKESA